MQPMDVEDPPVPAAGLTSNGTESGTEIGPGGERELSFADKILTLVAFVFIVVLEMLPIAPFDRFFIEQDSDLSHPLVESTVGKKLLVVLVLIIPLAILAVCKQQNLAPRRATYARLLIGLLLAMAVQGCVVDILKNLVGRPRPNFFAVCDYKHYQKAMEEYSKPGLDKYPLMDAYLAETKYGTPGKYSKCEAKEKKDNWESRLSFPSGHTSYAFCGLGWLGLALSWFAKEKRFNSWLPAALHLVPVMVAAWIGATRIRDYWHREDDVLAGALKAMQAQPGSSESCCDIEVCSPCNHNV
eukprot:CAMPEP_0206465338 /NCGR_PEP_ID=MMETSP0324_2-20121206/27766_1 /ASSEMBLY_ACC=CAM_ASM_000836 /TAXON_ID=2866 /ORGANISM="Crypthecodinium cohnii, Strain Seligo" /LENGTH=298 /DNA_ID=CAMNT_0053938169 /DNA_START=121 /DNA_END=1015 /DNA_ORIENTATION=-